MKLKVYRQVYQPFEYDNVHCKHFAGLMQAPGVFNRT